MNALEISSDKSRLDLELIYNFLTNSYWAKGRTKETIQKCVEGSVCLGAYLDGNQVGFLRAVTDKALFGYIFDVFIIEKWRGQGFSLQLMKALIEDPEYRQTRWMLKTTNAGELYKKLGFAPMSSADGLYIRSPNS